ncbi:hypothetical protein H3Z83_03605 [Tenacibaculum sp. S7007]|uniref:Serine kinase n=1 Tax=Tenacibaculum pelagium TaxID=2759527 RepID=A0A839AN36_9FLAO|nr:hypothetical protein [Tenacibaculum pelagium]MBA6155609.1 hypothetical protein [Tenacibaculum pelagium]
MLVKQIENKSIVWFEDNNEYIVVEPLVAEILSSLKNNVEKKEIITKLLNSLNIPYKQAESLVSDIKALLKTNVKKESIRVQIEIPSNFNFTKFYQINNLIFQVDFQSDYEMFLVHPKFSHLEVKTPNNINYHYKVYSNKECIGFSVNDVLIDTWTINDVHFFQGKFSMKLVEHLHEKEEKDWMGVFHASAISNGKSSILFLGDSGNGKSTSLALLQANGFTCLADDFVPIDVEKQEVFSFPSAISIKKNSLETLLPIYPELASTAEYHFKRLNKIVRYLKPNNSDYTNHLPCKALVFIKYKKGSDINIKEISNIDAFEQLVPDSWLPPIKESAQVFLNWFTKLPCYQLTYSNNEKMIESVSNFFNDDL